jgi:mRNA interferase YafQ
MTKRTTNRTIKRSKEFKRSFKRYMRSGLDCSGELESIIRLLVTDQDIPENHRDHKLAACKDFMNCRELHVRPDLLLVYRLTESTLELIQLGSHSDLFK